MDNATVFMSVACPRARIPPEARDLLRRLLVRDPSNRLGAGGAKEVMRHPFFEGLDWGKLRARNDDIPGVQEGLLVPESTMTPTGAGARADRDKKVAMSTWSMGVLANRLASLEQHAHDEVRAACVGYADWPDEYMRTG